MLVIICWWYVGVAARRCLTKVHRRLSVLDWPVIEVCLMSCWCHHLSHARYDTSPSWIPWVVVSLQWLAHSSSDFFSPQWWVVLLFDLLVMMIPRPFCSWRRNGGSRCKLEVSLVCVLWLRLWADEQYWQPMYEKQMENGEHYSGVASEKTSPHLNSYWVCVFFKNWIGRNSPAVFVVKW